MFNPTVERRIRPIPHAFDIPVFHGVIVKIIKMPGIILFVPQGVFPEPALQNPAPPLPYSRTAARLFDSAGGQIRLAEFFLDPAPARRIPGIAFGQSPDGMKVIFEQNQGIDPKRPTPPAFADSGAQTGASDVGTKNRSAPFRDHGKEERTARNVGAEITGHGQRIPIEKDGERRMELIPARQMDKPT